MEKEMVFGPDPKLPTCFSITRSSGMACKRRNANWGNGHMTSDRWTGTCEVSRWELKPKVLHPQVKAEQLIYSSKLWFVSPFKEEVGNSGKLLWKAWPEKRQREDESTRGEEEGGGSAEWEERKRIGKVPFEWESQGWSFKQNERSSGPASNETTSYTTTNRAVLLLTPE